MGLSVALPLCLLGLFLLWYALKLRRSTGIPWSRVRGQDVLGRELEKPLYARRYGLTGKPDYLIEKRGQLIPVEVKPTRRASEPYESDLMQLAAYCLLVEACYEQTPPYGLLRYADQTFRLDFDDGVRDRLLDLLDEMREAFEEDDCPRSHNQAQRCANCGFREQCDESLADS
jgi:CRISPR-associated exonuclease Cas4